MLSIDNERTRAKVPPGVLVPFVDPQQLGVLDGASALGGTFRVRCRSCSADTSVYRTTKTTRADVRERVCVGCGERWETVERETPGSRYKPATNGSLIALPWQPGSSPVAKAGRGVGGVLPAGIDPAGSDPSPGLLSNPNRARARSKPPAKYTEEFEELWTGTGRRGHKELALRAWDAKGKPDPKSVITAWICYCASLEEWRSPKDLSSWLNISGHLQRWDPAAPKPTNGHAPAESFAERDARVRRESAAREKITAEASRRAQERRLAADRAVTPATPEELAALRAGPRGPI